MLGLLFSIAVGIVIVGIIGYNGYDMIRNNRRDREQLRKDFEDEKAEVRTRLTDLERRSGLK